MPVQLGKNDYNTRSEEQQMEDYKATIQTVRKKEAVVLSIVPTHCCTVTMETHVSLVHSNSFTAPQWLGWD